MHSMHPYRVLILGGYGFFGQRLLARLARWSGLQLLIAGRNVQRAQACADALRPGASSELTGLALDADDPQLARQLESVAPQLLIHCSGPFQGQDYRVARACLAAGIHYIDLADGREFVGGIGRLDEAAKAAGLCLISGASSVPAISSAAALQLAEDLSRVDMIDIGISPGNRTERGLATMQAVLSYCGQALPGAGPVYGWVGCRTHVYPPPVGPRLLSPCDVPDLTLLGPCFAGLPQVRFGAGLELSVLHRAMNLMAQLTRWGLVRDWSHHAHRLKPVVDLFKRQGTDAGAMHVRVEGIDALEHRRARQWQLVASAGDGPFVPTLAAAALLRKLRDATPTPWIGAQPCIGLLTLGDIIGETPGLQITTMESEP